MSSLYIHIPFCRSKCLYCDFYSRAPQGLPAGIASRYIEALEIELDARADELSQPIHTLYIGGGTPSMLSPDHIKQLGGMIGARFDLSKVKEATIEANPDDISEEIVETWMNAGINRISIGVQSFVDSELLKCGRRHSAAKAHRAVEIASSVGNVSLDLIFGLPGQTCESWKYSVDTAIELHPDHISAYSLMFEPDTAFTRLRDLGKLQPADDDTTLEMFEILRSTLSKAGYEQYEISNFAIPGKKSLHNSTYWSGRSYMGLGAAAHSYDGTRLRRANIADISAYINDPITSFTSETLSDEELREEYILTRLRTREGIDMHDYAERFGSDAYRRLMHSSIPSLNAGTLRLDDDRLHLTQAGILVSDAIILSLA